MSLLPVSIKVSCPYCGYERDVNADEFKYQNSPVLVYCEGEFGGEGCGKHYAVRVSLTIERTTQLLSGE